jgi:hypothetical protein
MKIGKFLLVSCIVVVFMITMRCGDEPGGDPGLSTLDSISAITFGTVWNAGDSSVGDTGRIFSTSDTTIFYQIAFNDSLLNWFMIKKLWLKQYATNQYDTLFTSVVLIPSDCKRICGELRRYSEQPLDTGTYHVNIAYFRKDSGYVGAIYKSDVDRVFEIR